MAYVILFSFLLARLSGGISRCKNCSHPVLFSIPLFPVQYAVSICTEQFTLDYVSLFEITDLRPLDTPVFVHRKE